MTRRLLTAVFVVAALTLGACSADTGSVGDPIPGEKVRGVERSMLPEHVLDLAVTQESVSEQLRAVDRAFVDAVGLFAFRDNQLVKATLQLSEFNDRAKVGDRRFQQTVLATIGGTTPREYRLGGEIVHVSTGKRQLLAVWFRDRWMMVLSVRNDYLRPRALLRELVALDPGSGR